MKVALAGVAVFTVAVVGTLAYKNSGTPTQNKPTPAETVTVNNNTAEGNIIDNLKNKETVTENKKDILRLTVDSKRVVTLHSEVSYYSMKEATEKLKQLEKESNEPIILDIDSPGGSVIDGGTLISQMEASKAPVYTVCRRLCASMGAMIHSYGHKRYSLDRALLMYHPATGGVDGQIPNMLSLLKTIQRYIDKMNFNVINRSGGKLSREEFESLVAYEIWIDSEDALQKGLIDGIVNLSFTGKKEEPKKVQEGAPTEESTTAPKRKLDIKMIAPDQYLSLWNK